MLPKRRKSTHPGVVLLEDFLKPLEISPKQFAEKLGGKWSELKVTAIIQGKEGLSETTAEEFAAALGNSAEFWRRLEQKHNQCEKCHSHNEMRPSKPLKKAQ